MSIVCARSRRSAEADLLFFAGFTTRSSTRFVSVLLDGK